MRTRHRRSETSRSGALPLCEERQRTRLTTRADVAAGGSWLSSVEPSRKAVPGPSLSMASLRQQPLGLGVHPGRAPWRIRHPAHSARTDGEPPIGLAPVALDWKPCRFPTNPTVGDFRRATPARQLRAVSVLTEIDRSSGVRPENVAQERDSPRAGRPAVTAAFALRPQVEDLGPAGPHRLPGLICAHPSSHRAKRRGPSTPASQTTTDSLSRAHREVRQSDGPRDRLDPSDLLLAEMLGRGDDDRLRRWGTKAPLGKCRRVNDGDSAAIVERRHIAETDRG